MFYSVGAELVQISSERLWKTKKDVQNVKRKKKGGRKDWQLEM